MKVMCNASPIIALSIINQLNLLWDLFDVYISHEVYNEIVLKSKSHSIGKSELENAIKNENITIYDVKNQELVFKLYGKLHKGELETVIGANELGLNVVIIDEKSARQFALNMNLKPLGTFGILKLAKTKGKIKCVKPYLDDLIKNKYRISDKLYCQILNEVGEL